MLESRILPLRHLQNCRILIRLSRVRLGSVGTLLQPRRVPSGRNDPESGLPSGVSDSGYEASDTARRLSFAQARRDTDAVRDTSDPCPPTGVTPKVDTVEVSSRGAVVRVSDVHNQ